MANSVDPDQTPHSGGTLFAKAYLTQYLGLLWYIFLLLFFNIIYTFLFGYNRIVLF